VNLDYDRASQIRDPVIGVYRGSRMEINVRQNIWLVVIAFETQESIIWLDDGSNFCSRPRIASTSSGQNSIPRDFHVHLTYRVALFRTKASILMGTQTTSSAMMGLNTAIPKLPSFSRCTKNETALRLEILSINLKILLRNVLFPFHCTFCP
jgi:hypothetical protein